MKYSTVAVTLAAFVVGVVAQGGAPSLQDLPECPRKCILGGTAKTECSIIDIPCSCRDLSYQAQLAECMASCPPEEAAKGAQVGAGICKAAGVEITIPSITSTTSVPAATTTPSSTSTSAAAPTETPETPETPVEDDEDDEEDTGATTTAVVVVPVPTTTLISSTISAAPAPTGNSTTNGTVTPPVATATPPAQEDSGAGQVAIGSLLGVAVMGAVAFAL